MLISGRLSALFCLRISNIGGKTVGWSCPPWREVPSPRGGLFAAATRVNSSVMNIRIWFLLAVAAFCLLTVIQPASARSVESPRPDHARIHRLLSRSNPAVELARGQGSGTYSAGQGRMNPVASGDPAVLFLRASSSQKHRRGQADDDQDDGSEASLTSSEQHDAPSEWQLIRPDSQRANSFIHSKAKPPP